MGVLTAAATGVPGRRKQRDVGVPLTDEEKVSRVSFWTYIQLRDLYRSCSWQHCRAAPHCILSRNNTCIDM